MVRIIVCILISALIDVYMFSRHEDFESRKPSKLAHFKAIEFLVTSEYSCLLVCVCVCVCVCVLSMLISPPAFKNLGPSNISSTLCICPCLFKRNGFSCSCFSHYLA